MHTKLTRGAGENVTLPRPVLFTLHRNRTHITSVPRGCVRAESRLSHLHEISDVESRLNGGDVRRYGYCKQQLFSAASIVYSGNNQSADKDEHALAVHTLTHTDTHWSRRPIVRDTYDAASLLAAATNSCANSTKFGLSCGRPADAASPGNSLFVPYTPAQSRDGRRGADGDVGNTGAVM